jgi:hypothetical protein
MQLFYDTKHTILVTQSSFGKLKSRNGKVDLQRVQLYYFTIMADVLFASVCVCVCMCVCVCACVSMCVCANIQCTMRLRGQVVYSCMYDYMLVYIPVCLELCMYLYGSIHVMRTAYLYIDCLHNVL